MSHFPAKIIRCQEENAEITDRAVTPEDVERIMQENGLSEISARGIHDLAAIGIYLHGAGVMRVQRGRSLITQQRLDQAMRLLQEELIITAQDREAKPKDRVDRMTKLAQSIGYLSSKVSESQELMLSTDQAGRPAVTHMPQDEPTARSFSPGAIVRGAGILAVGNEIHVHSDPPKPAA
jgi:hypothetical protein